MADDYKINIGTEADTSGAKDAEKAINQLGTAADKAADAVESVGNEARDVATGGGKALNQTFESTAQSAEGTRKILGGLGALMGGNVLFGVQELTQGFRALNVTMGANPAGKVIAAISIIAGGWAVVAKALEDADTAAKDLEGGMKDASASADELGTKASAIDKIKDAISGAADQAERLRKAKDETADIDAALQISQVDLKEAKGEISPDDARAQRTGIRAENQRAKLQAANEADQAQIAIAKEQQQKIDEEAEAASQRAARAREHLAKTAAEANAAGAPTALIEGGDFSKAKADAARQLEYAQSANNLIDSESDPQTEERAKKKVDSLDDLETAYKHDREAREAEAKLTETRKKSAEDTSKLIQEKTQKVQNRVKESATLENKTTTEGLTLQKDKAAREKKETEDAAEKKKKQDKWTEDAQGFVKNHQEIRDLPPDFGRKPEEDPAEMGRKIAEDGAGLKGRSPEQTARVQEALGNVKDGNVTAEDVARLNDVIDKLITSLEKMGKNSAEAKDIKSKITALEGKVNRLDSQQGK